MNKENEYSEKTDVKVKVESEAQDLFNAHDFDITIDLGKNNLLDIFVNFFPNNFCLNIFPNIFVKFFPNILVNFFRNVFVIFFPDIFV